MPALNEVVPVFRSDNEHVPVEKQFICVHIHPPPLRLLLFAIQHFGDDVNQSVSREIMPIVIDLRSELRRFIEFVDELQIDETALVDRARPRIVKSCAKWSRWDPLLTPIKGPLQSELVKTQRTKHTPVSVVIHLVHPVHQVRPGFLEFQIIRPLAVVP